jgi:hypothetical protein
MSAAVLAFVPHEKIDRAVTVLDIALGRGLAFERALHFAVESLGEEPGAAPQHVRRLVEATWRRRSERLLGARG